MFLLHIKTTCKYFAHKIEANAQPVIISNLGQQVDLFRKI